MKSLNNLNNYINSHHIPMSEDSITKELIKSHFKDIELKQKWGSMLDDDFNLKEITRFPEPTIPLIKNRGFILVIIAVILSVLMMVLTQWSQKNNLNESSLQALLNDHYANPVPRELMKGPAEDIPIEQNPYSLYQAKEYKKAIPIFIETIEKEPLIEEHHFYLGLSYLYDGKPKEAIKKFDWILNQDKSNRKDMAIWFKALALTEAGDFKEAKTYLQIVESWNTNTGKSALALEAKKLLQMIGEE